MTLSAPVVQKAEAAVQRVTRFVNAFPRPASASQVVQTRYVRDAVALLRPLAARVAALPVGTPKGTIAGGGEVAALASLFTPLYNLAAAIEGAAQPATGYLTGPTVTAADHTTAQFILALTDKILPAQPALLDPTLYATIKQQCHRLLMIATDLDVDTSVADQVTLLWASVKDAVRDLAALAPRAAGRALGLLEITLIALGVGGGIYVIKTLAGR